MPAVCLVAQKPRECTQEYVIIEGADKGRRCRDRRSCPYKAPSDFARDRPKSGGVRESRSQRQGPMSQDAYRPPVAVFADHASPHRADHVAPELGAKPRRAGATLSRTASVSACSPGKPRGSLGARLLGALPTMAFAQLGATAERRAACMGDAIMLCSSAIPNKARIASCLASKMDQLTPRCRAQFSKR
jgi:hypothetical protein